MSQVSRREIQVFLCHSHDDKATARELHRRLVESKINAWLDEEKLLPGQNWEEEIPKALMQSDIVIVCLSKNSINKDGYLQKEIRIALDVATQKPEGIIYIIPLKLEECNIPEKIHHLHAVNYFDEKGFEKLILSITARALKLREQGEQVKLPLKPKPSKTQSQQIEDVFDLKTTNEIAQELPLIAGDMAKEDTLQDVEDEQPYQNKYSQISTETTHPLNECKIIVVGQGAVGKTSLVKRLVSNTFDVASEKTEGVSISHLRIKNRVKNGNYQSPIMLNIWDLGGQEIMNTTHQFFLSKRSLYLLVLDSRLTQEENRVEYWLRIIQSFGGASPVLIIGNKIDQHPLDIDRKGLQKKYPNIIGFLATSAATGAGIEEFKSTIMEQANNLPHVHDLLPATWFKIKTQLEELGSATNFITYDKYIELCTENEVTDETSQRTLIAFLHDLGVVLHFQDDPRLEALGILNPQWVTNGIYRILNSNAVFQNKGVLTVPMLDDILNLPEYPRGKRLFIVDMMKKFELCYDIEPDKTFLVPDLLPRDEPTIDDWSDALSFCYKYAVLPSSIFSRFLVRMRPFAKVENCWRYGAVLNIENNSAIIKTDYEERTIFISVSGNQNTRRDFLSAIRYQFDAIHSTFQNLDIHAQVPHPDYPQLLLNYDELLEFERQGLTEFPGTINGKLIMVDIKKSLNGVEAESQRKERDSNVTHIYIGGNFGGNILVGDENDVRD